MFFSKYFTSKYVRVVACLIQSNTIPAALRLSHAQLCSSSTSACHIGVPSSASLIVRLASLSALGTFRPVFRPSARLIELTFSANVLHPVVEGSHMSAELMRRLGPGYSLCASPSGLGLAHAALGHSRVVARRTNNKPLICHRPLRMFGLALDHLTQLDYPCSSSPWTVTSSTGLSVHPGQVRLRFCHPLPVSVPFLLPPEVVGPRPPIPASSVSCV